MPKKKISISQIKCFKGCRREYFLKYIEKLEPVQKSDALEAGISYHAKIQEIYEKGYFEQGFDNDFAKTSAMAFAYEKYIYPKFKIKSVEDWFTYSINDIYDLIGRTDGITEDGFLVEHKTTSSEITEQYEYNLLWDEQILAYMLATNTRKVFYTVCRKPTIRQKQNETEEEFFDRMCKWFDEDTESKIKVLEITRTDEEVEDFANHLRIMCNEIEHNNLYYRNTRECNMWGTRCPYSSVCLNYDPTQEYIEFTRKEKE